MTMNPAQNGPSVGFWSLNGNVFRSFADGQWAVFFEAVGLKWNYQNAFCDSHLPLFDFYLPEFLGGTFVKVGLYVSDRETMTSLADDFDRKIILVPRLLDPYQIGVDAFLPKSQQHEEDFVWDFDNRFVVCEGCETVSLMSSAYVSMKDVCCQKCRILELDIESVARKAKRRLRLSGAEKNGEAKK